MAWEVPKLLNVSKKRVCDTFRMVEHGQQSICAGVGVLHSEQPELQGPQEAVVAEQHVAVHLALAPQEDQALPHRQHLPQEQEAEHLVQQLPLDPQAELEQELLQQEQGRGHAGRRGYV